VQASGHPPNVPGMVDLGGGPAPTPFSARFAARFTARSTPRTSTRLPTRSAARLLEATNVSLFRLSKGRLRGTVLGASAILLTTSSHKTGARHTKPLAAFEDGIAWIVAGSNAPTGDREWYENLVAYEASQQATCERSANAPVLIAPEVEYSGNRRIAVRAQVLVGEERAKWWARMVEASPRLDADRAGDPPPPGPVPVLRLTPLGY
jgi:hypothetical protein